MEGYKVRLLPRHFLQRQANKEASNYQSMPQGNYNAANTQDTPEDRAIQTAAANGPNKKS